MGALKKQGEPPYKLSTHYKNEIKGSPKQEWNQKELVETEIWNIIS